MLSSDSFRVISKLARGIDPKTGNPIGQAGIQIDQTISQALSGALTELRRMRPKSFYELNDEEMELFIKLKEYRYGKANEIGKPAFRVAPDETLARIAMKNPQSIGALHGIYGLQKKRIDAYGADLVSVVCDHLRSKGSAGK